LSSATVFLTIFKFILNYITEIFPSVQVGVNW
jgi:hypothetical protein